MKNNKIHEHIDTLYLSYMCKHEFEYNSILTSCLDYEFLGTVYNNKIPFFMYRSNHFRLKIVCDYESLESSNNYHCEIQYEHNELFPHVPYKLLDSLVLPFDLDVSRYIIKRIDYNVTFKSDDTFDYTDSGYISKYFRGKWREYENTVYLGSRKSSNKLFRIYDKKKELIENKSALKYDMLMQYFNDDIEDLITFEIELKRGYIRDSLDAGNGSLFYFKEILHDAVSLLKSIEVFPLNDNNKSKYKNRNYNRIKDKRYLLDMVRTNPLLSPHEKYTPKVSNMVKRINIIKKDFEKRLGREISIEEMVLIMTEDDNIESVEFEYKD